MDIDTDIEIDIEIDIDIDIDNINTDASNVNSDYIYFLNLIILTIANILQSGFSLLIIFLIIILYKAKKLLPNSWS